MLYFLFKHYSHFIQCPKDILKCIQFLFFWNSSSFADALRGTPPPHSIIGAHRAACTRGARDERVHDACWRRCMLPLLPPLSPLPGDGAASRASCGSARATTPLHSRPSRSRAHATGGVLPPPARALRRRRRRCAPLQPRALALTHRPRLIIHRRCAAAMALRVPVASRVACRAKRAQRRELNRQDVA